MCKKWRRKKNHSQYTDRVEERFQTIITLVRDLDKREFNRLQEGMQLAWEAYSKVRQAKSNEEREVGDIDIAEKLLSE